jgi:hypothetical protein
MQMAYEQAVAHKVMNEYMHWQAYVNTLPDADGLRTSCSPQGHE